MINSFSMQVFPSINENNAPNIFRTISKIDDYCLGNFQTISSFYPKSNIQKRNSATFLTEQQYEFKNLKPQIHSLEIMGTNPPIYNNPIYSEENKRKYSFNEYNKNKSHGLQRYHSSINLNILNLSNINNDDNKYFDSTNENEILHTDTNFMIDRINNDKIPKVLNMNLIESDLLPRQTINQYNNINYNNEIFSNDNNISNNYIDNNYELNNSINNLSANSDFHSSLVSSLSLDNMNSTYEEQPNSNFKLSEFIIVNEIGKGSEGTIYTVKWKKNNKNYALKKCEYIYDEEVKKKKQENNVIKEFVETTGCDGVIKIYGNLCSSNEFGTNYFYELMELAEKNWEQEILKRQKMQLFYQEYELMDMFSHLIKTFSSLQSINFTHRDINPQNIMIVNGKLKICDFGNSKLLKKNGVIIQKVRGSEIFMSPIVFKGYHGGMQTIKHNTFKSDVFSLGMCFFLAASLNYDALNVIREIYNMNIAKKILNKYLGKRYSLNLIELLVTMLQVDEKKRPDFNELELMLP